MADIKKLSTNISKVFAIVMLRSDNSRIYSQYYTKICSPHLVKTLEGNLSNLDTQLKFEKNIAEKSKKLTSAKTLKASDTEIFSYGNFNIIFKSLNDVQIYVIGDFDENEILLSQVMNAIYESLNHFTKNSISKKTILENFENLIILIDEVVDEGIIVSVEPNTIVARTTMKDCDSVNLITSSESGSTSTATTSSSSSGTSAFSQVFASAKSQISKTLNLH